MDWVTRTLILSFEHGVMRYAYTVGSVPRSCLCLVVPNRNLGSTSQWIAQSTFFAALLPVGVMAKPHEIFRRSTAAPK